VFWIRGDRCRRSSFFGGLTSEFMDHIPENSTYHTRAKAQNVMCEEWRHNGTNLCLNYFLTYDQKYFFQNRERHPLRELSLNPELEVLPRLKEIPPPLTLVTITVHPPNSCDDKPIRTIDFLDFTILSSTSQDGGGGDEVPGFDEETFSSLFQPPIGLVCQDSTFSSFTSMSSSASSSSSSSAPISTFSSGEP
jgi:hypothetical protein